MSTFNEFIERKRGEIQSGNLLDIMTWVFPAFSSIATLVGIYKLTGNPWMAIVGSIVAFLFCAAFYRRYIQWFPAADNKSRFKLLGPMIFFAVVAIALTTTFSVATFGGDVALRKDFEKTITSVDVHGRARLAALENEQSLAASLGQASQEFADLSKEEAGGAFTGVTGRGSATITFETVGRQLGRMHDQVAANKPTIDQLKTEEAQYLRDLRTISYEHTSQAQKVAEFSTKLNQIKDLFDRMDAASVIPAVQQASGNLGIVAQLQGTDGNAAVAAKQSVTIGKAQQLVTRVQQDINRAAADLKASDTAMPPLQVMDESEAIFVYWRSIAWAWAIALVLDFAPMVFLYMLSVFNDINTPEHRRRKKKLQKVALEEGRGPGSVSTLRRP